MGAGNKKREPEPLTVWALVVLLLGCGLLAVVHLVIDELVRGG